MGQIVAYLRASTDKQDLNCKWQRNNAPVESGALS